MALNKHLTERGRIWWERKRKREGGKGHFSVMGWDVRVSLLITAQLEWHTLPLSRCNVSTRLHTNSHTLTDSHCQGGALTFFLTWLNLSCSANNTANWAKDNRFKCSCSRMMKITVQSVGTCSVGDLKYKCHRWQEKEKSLHYKLLTKSYMIS